MRLPAWLVDVLVALALVALAIGVERFTEGRLANESLLLWVGGGLFVLLRLGDFMARAGPTLGCLFGFAATWSIPCVAVGFMVASDDFQRVVRDSLPLFMMLGGYMIVFMGITLERMRRYEQRTLAAE